MQLRDGLRLHSLRDNPTGNRDDVATFYRDVFVDQYGEGDEPIKPWTLDLIAENHPTVTDDDVWMVIDPTRDNMIVSAVLLIPQVWRYENIEIPVGRVELVATHKDYRNRGLVRALIDTAHERSATLGHKMQGITGIPHYYRQFGYAMAVRLGSGAEMPLSTIKPLPEDKTPDFTIKPATEADIPDIMAFSDYHDRQTLLSVVRTPDEWRYELSGKRPESDMRYDTFMIVDSHQQNVGYLCLLYRGQSNRILTLAYVVGERSSYLATFEDVLRAIKAHADALEDEFLYLAFEGNIHPTVYTLLDHKSYTKIHQYRYAWYIRIPDMADFLTTIAQVLERRLKESGANRYSGSIGVTFHDKTGVTLTFEDGKLIEASNTPPEFDKEDA
ncbi:MAG: GNAT family N-acetyltransferase, partial [Chloroflexi bacterium]|nr:GNAT family N-acetyltransferase [Chloroflexota bacterium]